MRGGLNHSLPSNRLAFDFQSAREKQNKGKQWQEKDKQATNKYSPRKQNCRVGYAEGARRAQAGALLEINRGYLEVCFGFEGVVDLKWMVGEEGGHSRPLAIHHGPLFDSPNACS